MVSQEESIDITDEASEGMATKDASADVVKEDPSILTVSEDIDFHAATVSAVAIVSAVKKKIN